MKYTSVRVVQSSIHRSAGNAKSIFSKMPNYFFELAAYAVSDNNSGLLSIVPHLFLSCLTCPIFFHSSWSSLRSSCLTSLCILSSFRLSSFFFLTIFPSFLSCSLSLPHLTLSVCCAFHRHHLLLYVLFLLPSVRLSFCLYVADPSDQDAQEEGEK